MNRAQKKVLVLSAAAAVFLALAVSAAFAAASKEGAFAPEREVVSLKEVEFAPGEILIQIKEGVDIRKVIIGSGVGVKWMERLYPITAVTAKLKASNSYKGKKCAALSNEELFALAEPGLPPYKRALYRTYHLWLSKDDNVWAAIARLKANPKVTYAEPNYVFSLYFEPADPAYAKYQRKQFHAAIKSPAAWDIARGDGVVVAVIDSGADMQHADLKDNIWVNKAEIPDNGSDDDCNGYIDDVRGWNAAGDNGRLDDSMAHGTLCAGLVGAPVNGIGVVGVSPKVRIMPVKVSMKSLWPKIYLAHVAAAVNYSIENKADIIAMPLGCRRDSDTLRSIIKEACKNNILLVAAAGNEGSALINYPAGYEEVLSVASVNKKNEGAGFGSGQKSNFGRTIDISAPGESITSTIPQDGYGISSGTSLSCSMVAGAAALVLSKNRDWSALEVKNALMLGADPGIKSTQYLGMGVLNVEAALKIKKRISAEANISDPDYSQAQDEKAAFLRVCGRATGESYKVLITPAANSAYAPDALWEEIGKGIAIPVGILAQRSIKDLESGDYFVKLVVDAGGGHFLKDVSRFKWVNNYPAIKALEPSFGSAGEDITVKGFNFGTDPGNGSVYFDGIKAAAKPGGWSATEIICKVPFDIGDKKFPPGPYDVTVRGAAFGVSNPKTFNVNPTQPRIDSLTPSQAAFGAQITIKGAGFGAPQCQGNVIFGGKTISASYWSDTCIKVYVPEGFSSGISVKVSDERGIESNAAGFKVTPSPHIESLIPAYGPTGISLAINGINFGASAGTVKLGGVAAAVSPGGWTDGSISCAAPAPLLNGEYEVRVYDSAGALSDNIVELIVRLPVPHINNINPKPVVAGQEIDISGFDFGVSSGKVRISGMANADLDVSHWSKGRIKARIPALGYGGGAWVIVTSADGQESIPYALMIEASQT